MFHVVCCKRTHARKIFSIEKNVKRKLTKFLPCYCCLLSLTKSWSKVKYIVLMDVWFKIVKHSFLFLLTNISRLYKFWQYNQELFFKNIFGERCLQDAWSIQHLFVWKISLFWRSNLKWWILLFWSNEELLQFCQ